MRRPQVLILLLILASVLVDVVVSVVIDRRADPGPLFLFFFALQISQMTLVAMWLCLGRTPGSLRVIAALATVAAWNWLMPRSPSPMPNPAWLLTQLMFVWAPGSIACGLGLHVCIAAEVHAPPSSRAAPRRLQFSILQLLGWTTAVAVVLSTLKSLNATDPQVYTYFWHMSDIVFLISNAAIAWTTAWAALGRGRLVLRCAVMVVIVAAALGGLIVTDSFSTVLRIIGSTQKDPVPGADQFLLMNEFLTTFFTELYIILTTLLMFASLFVVRFAGYRLAFRRVRTKPDVEATVVQQ